MEAHNETWLTTQDICKRLGVSDRAVRNWILRGELDAIFLGRRAGYRIAATAFDTFVNGRLLKRRAATEQR